MKCFYLEEQLVKLRDQAGGAAFGNAEREVGILSLSSLFFLVALMLPTLHMFFFSKQVVELKVMMEEKDRELSLRGDLLVKARAAIERMQTEIQQLNQRLSSTKR